MTSTPTNYFVTGVFLSATLAGYLTVHPEALQDSWGVQAYTAAETFYAQAMF